MAIGDLLAQITGQPSAPAAKPTLPRVNILPKRKVDDGTRKDAPPTPRTVTPQSKPAQVSRPLDRQSTSASKPPSSASKSSILSSKPMNGTNKITKPQPSVRPSPVATSNGASSSPTVKSAPKKGSFAEIMARANKAQAVMGQVGKIQHKKVEGGVIKKERELKTEQRAVPSKRGPGYSGSSIKKDGPVRSGPSARDGANGRSRSDPPEAPAKSKGLSAKKQAELDREHERKLKKLSQPSSYAGTSRGKPADAKRPGSKPMPRGGALLSAPKSRPSKSSRYEDDYDEELDDFIDYDDEEDDFGGGPRYDYASDGSSDMEAGLDDIDSEERRAERIARLEDIEEQRLEQNLKMAKEERKRRALEELRAHKRR
ncbi:hypothetical protein NLU13_6026 [Sarocladium strictum]|uniref:SPT2 n=1 Tax=Sarocladium strictum TaxID=5046 RepID=A0AA39GFV0_SARSR|nr:hypothetical protein NLU13_6026 [Sarocladium strictum]